MGRVLRTVLGLGVAIYLTAAGWFFVLAPWNELWTALIVHGAPWWMAPFLASPTLRGALGGFGVLHFAVAYTWLEDSLRKP